MPVRRWRKPPQVLIEQRTGHGYSPARKELVLNTEYTVESVTVSADGRSATARMRSEIRIGTESRLYLKMSEVQTDTIIRRYGRARFLDSDGDTSL